MNNRTKHLSWLVLVLTLFLLTSCLSRTTDEWLMTQSALETATARPQTEEPTLTETVDALPGTPTVVESETPVPEESITPTLDAQETIVVTVEATTLATPTRIVEDTPAPTASVEPTDQPVNDPNNRLTCGDFECGYRLETTASGGGFVFNGWNITACNEPWTPQACQIPPPYCDDVTTSECNDPGEMATCEFKIADNETGDPFRVHSGGFAQQWFIPGKIAQCGIYQDIQTQPGEVCKIRAWAQSWGSHLGPSNVSGNPNRSDYKTQSDRNNMTFWFGAHIDGERPPFPYGDVIVRSPSFGYANGLYDEAAENDLQGGDFIEWSFTANRSITTIYIMAGNKYPLGNNNWYVDDVSVTCEFPEQLGQGGGGEIVAEEPTQETGENNMLDNLLASGLPVQIVIFLIAAGFVVVKVIEELKKRGKIADGAAGEWATNLSLLVSALIGVAQIIGAGDFIQPVEAWATDAGMVVAGTIALIGVSKLVYLYLKWTGGAQSISEKLLRGAGSSAAAAIKKPAPHPGMPANS